MTEELNVNAAALNELIGELGLQRHPEGGWYRETWTAGFDVQPAGYPDVRHGGSAIYYCLGPGEASRWHRVRSAELWLYHRGGGLSLALGGGGARPDETARQILGPDVGAGHRPQLVIPPGVWQSARPLGEEPVLVSCVVVPGFDFDDFEMP